MRALIAAVLLAFATPALAAPVELPVSLRDGASWTITATHTRKTDTDGAVSEVRSESRTRATYHTGKRAGLVLVEPLPGSAAADLALELHGFHVDFPLEFDVDEALRPQRMRNWPRVRDAATNFLSAQPAAPRAAQMKSIVAGLSNESALGFFAPYLHYLGIGQGLALDPGQALTYEEETPNPFGGLPILTKGSVTLESYDPKQHRAVVVWASAFDPAAAAASMRESTKDIVRGAGATADDLAVVDKMSFDRRDRCRFELETTSGLVVRGDCESNLVVAAAGHSVRRTDTWVITQSLPGGR